MKISLKAFLFTFVFSVFQYSVFILAFVLEFLSTRKMGVARYLLYKKQMFETTLFSHSLVNVYNNLFTLGVFVCLFFLIWGKRKLPILIAVIANIFGAAVIQFKLQLNAFHFFLIGIFVVLVFQYFLLFMAKIKKQG